MRQRLNREYSITAMEKQTVPQMTAMYIKQRKVGKRKVGRDHKMQERDVPNIYTVFH